MSKFKRFFGISLMVLASCTLALGLVACTPPPSPSATVTKALDAIKAKDIESFEACLVSSAQGTMTEAFKEAAAEMNVSVDSPEAQELLDALIDKLVQFDYTIDGETVEQDQARVDVTITTYDMSKVFTSAVTEYFTQGIAAAISGASEEEMGALFVQAINEALDKQSEKSYSSSSSVSLVKEDNEWRIDDISEENYNSILGGVMAGLENLSESFGGLYNAS